MRALAVAPSPAERSSWERLLVETMRTDFRVEVFIAPEGSPLLGAGCAVAGCTGYGYHRPWGRGTGRALRQKLASHDRRLVIAVWGVGYRLCDPAVDRSNAAS
jgi:hypothetical protein